jgi:hypothetical protein
MIRTLVYAALLVVVLGALVIIAVDALMRAGQRVEASLAEIDPEVDDPIDYQPTGFYEQLAHDAYERHVAQALEIANPPLDVSLLPEDEREHVLAWESEFARRGTR